MSTVTSRINATNNDVGDRFNSHNSPQWSGDVDGQLGVFTEAFVGGDWSGGIRNISLRFPSITIPPGATITSAKVTFIRNSGAGGDRTMHEKITGIAEDNTGVFTPATFGTTVDDARTRSHTSAAVDWDFVVPNSGSSGDVFDSADITSIIQEIINRGGWASGNAIGLYFYDDGTTIDKYFDYKYYSSYPSDAPLLTITYETPNSPSVSPSSSQSPSRSPSASVSPSASTSRSPSPSLSRSPSPSPADHTNVIEISKDLIDILKTNNPQDMKFSSRFGTLKYFAKTTASIQIVGSGIGGDFAGRSIYTHNLGKYTYAEVFVSTYIGSPTGVYEYCPLFGAGASISYNANYILKQNTLELYAEFSGVSFSTWNFDFLIFLYKNDLKL